MRSMLSEIDHTVLAERLIHPYAQREICFEICRYLKFPLNIIGGVGAYWDQVIDIWKECGVETAVFNWEGEGILRLKVLYILLYCSRNKLTLYRSVDITIFTKDIQERNPENVTTENYIWLNPNKNQEDKHAFTNIFLFSRIHPILNFDLKQNWTRKHEIQATIISSRVLNQWKL